MKIKGAKAVHYDSGPNMTPLVDVVMVILIFMMLAGSFGTTTHYLMSKASIKANSPGGKPPPPGIPPDVNLDLYVQANADGMGFTAMINNDPTLSYSDPDQLAGVLAGKYQAFLAAGNPAGQLQVVLYPAKELKYQFIAQVYQAALKANFQKVAFHTTG